MDNGITAAPSNDKKARMASSWNSAKICSHILAVAEANGELKQFAVVLHFRS